MKRLTKYQPTEGGIPFVVLKSEESGEAGDHIQDALQKLAEYEDTGLTAEQIRAGASVYGNAISIAAKRDPKLLLDRLDEIIKAEVDGRLAILPCKVGDTVYALCGREAREYTVYHIDIFSDEIFIFASFDNGRSGRICTIGKTCFLTREEAEKALEGMG